LRSRLDLPISWVHFPQRCVNCGSLPETTVEVECSRGIDLLIFKYQKYFNFLLPVCFPCKKRRRVAGFASAIVLVAAFLGYLAGMFALESVFERWGQRELWAFLFMAIFLAAIYLARNWVTPLLDAWFLGVRGGNLSKSGVGTLWFRDRDFADRTEAPLRNDIGTAE